MDDIRFLVSHESLGGGEGRFLTIQPVVNGSLLRDLARAAEAPAAAGDGQPDLAGSYAGLCDVDVLRWPSRHYLGDPVLQWFDEGDTVLLGCLCGEWECWPLTAQIEVTEPSIRWHGFRNGHREWDLSALGPFEFDRAQYEGAWERTAG
ncbi:hypothetical protein [Microbacterium sp. NIBRBAC000506063]|uniref:hypothetical protein n=1 Tax=Microbacterium sp. NIBRBAC000506063 TaxID=2734618 RepID=UPI001BB53F17|nr:hypothetical protein [Microbacterium sp. NIBRBAC000506063]QTV80445.1 hypothetical protein KAE78_05900 [Microbacterium sp. NIBRBAC000506063]